MEMSEWIRNETVTTSELGHVIAVRNIIWHVIISLKYDIMRGNYAIAIKVFWLSSHKMFIFQGMLFSQGKCIIK